MEDFSNAAQGGGAVIKQPVKPFIPWKSIKPSLYGVLKEAEKKQLPEWRRTDVDYIQRRVGENRFETGQRRKSEKRLFDQLTDKQETAYQLIDEAYGYELAGLPCASMRYTDAPGGGDWELTERQVQVVRDYREWRSDLYRNAPAALYAVIRYMRGSNLTDIERALRIGHGKSALYISYGLNEYCKMKKWGANEQGRRIRITGYGMEISKFFANEVDDLGRMVWSGHAEEENKLEK